MEAIGAKYFIVTDTSKDGTLAGPNIDLYRNLKKEFPNAVITASGGISGLADVKKLLFSLSVPTITSQIVNMLYNLVEFRR